jgi:hypothetical protein
MQCSIVLSPSNPENEAKPAIIVKSNFGGILNTVERVAFEKGYNYNKKEDCNRH